MSLLKKLLGIAKSIHFQSLLGNGITAVFGLVILSILYRTLPVAATGKYALFMVTYGFVDTFRSGFLTSAFIKFYSGTQKGVAATITGSAWCLNLIVTVLLCLACFIVSLFSGYVTDEGWLFFLKYFLWLFLSALPFYMASLIAQGDKRFDRLLWIKVSNQVLYAALVLILAFTKKATLDSVLLAYIAAFATTSLFTIISGWANLGTIRYTSKATILALFNFGKFSLGTNLMANLFRVTDVFFVNILGPAAIAIYYLGARLLQIIEIPLSSFVQSTMPVLSNLYNNDEKEEMMLTLKRTAGIVTMGLITIAFISVIFAEPVIQVIGGKKYIGTEAPNVFRLFMSVAIFYAADRFFAIGVDVIHKPNVNFYKVIIMLALNAAIDWICITYFKTVYSVVAGNIVPTAAAIIITYFPLNKFEPFNFWEIYTTGFKEFVRSIKSVVSGLARKKVLDEVQ